MLYKNDIIHYNVYSSFVYSKTSTTMYMHYSDHQFCHPIFLLTFSIMRRLSNDLNTDECNFGWIEGSNFAVTSLYVTF